MKLDQLVRTIKRIALFLLGLVAVVYAGDYASVRVPIPKGRAVYSTVKVQPYYDVGLKSGKSDLYFLDPQNQTCVNSWFPHLGYKPCWYLKKHAHPRIKI